MMINPVQAYANYGINIPEDGSPATDRPTHIQEPGEVADSRCQTCMNRRYVDVSDDPGVSFQAPTRLTPGQAATAVPAHEREHYNREAARANREGREVIHNSIRIFTDVCEECGIQYISGGETRTVTRTSSEEGNPGAPEDGFLVRSEVAERYRNGSLNVLA